MAVTDVISAASAFFSALAAGFAWNIASKSHEASKEDRRLTALERYHLSYIRARMQVGLLHAAAIDVKTHVESLAVKNINFGSSRVRLATEELDEYISKAERYNEILVEINGSHSDKNELPVISESIRDVQEVLTILDAALVRVADVKGSWKV